jgi:hypothetical protein
MPDLPRLGGLAVGGAWLNLVDIEYAPQRDSII